MRWMVLLIVLGTGCGQGSGEAGVPTLLSPEQTRQERFVPRVFNSYFPLEAGTLAVYEGEDAGEQRRDEVFVSPEPVVIAGIACTAVEQEVTRDGVLAERTTEWFAQDLDGVVWKFGEESYELEEEIWVRQDDSWQAGIDGALASLLFVPRPSVGDVYFVFDPTGPDSYRVTSVSAVANVPAGLFQQCLEVHENPDDPEDADIILYARGVGMVSEQGTTGKIVLVSRTR